MVAPVPAKAAGCSLAGIRLIWRQVDIKEQSQRLAVDCQIRSDLENLAIRQERWSGIDKGSPACYKPGFLDRQTVVGSAYSV